MHSGAQRSQLDGAFNTMALTDRVKQILSWYSSENPGTLTNLVRLLNHGTLAGTGKMVILPVDQGFEHGPVRSFSPNPDAMDPDWHYQLAIDSGCNAYAAPLGSLELPAAKFAGQVRTRQGDGELVLGRGETMLLPASIGPHVVSPVGQAVVLTCQQP